jgi:hypothetical protein
VWHARRLGTWGPGIFSDDTAADVRGDFRELVEGGVPDDEATARVVDRYRDALGDEEHLLWLAPAAAQAQVGRLDEHVRARALEVIDGGGGLEEWEPAGHVPPRADDASAVAWSYVGREGLDRALERDLAG